MEKVYIVTDMYDSDESVFEIFATEELAIDFMNRYNQKNKHADSSVREHELNVSKKEAKKRHGEGTN